MAAGVISGEAWSQSAARSSAVAAARSGLARRIASRVGSLQQAQARVIRAERPAVASIVADPVPLRPMVSVDCHDSRLDAIWPAGSALPPNVRVAHWINGPALAPRQWCPPAGVSPPMLGNVPARAPCGAAMQFGVSRARYQGCGYWKCSVHGPSCCFRWQPVPRFEVDQALF